MTRLPLHSLSRTFAMPAAIALMSMTALIAALIGDGVWDVAGWLGLGLPFVLTLWAYRRQRGV